MKKLRSLLTVVLILALVFTSLMPVISAENVPPEESENVIAPDTDQPGDEVLSSPGEQRGRGRRSRFDDWDIEGNTEVTAIVIFDENGVIDIDANLKSARAKRAESSMRDGQRGFVSRMKSRMNVTLLYQYTVLANGIAIKTSYKNLKLIEEMEGVQAVYLDNAYSVPDTVQSIPSHAFTNMIAADWIWPPPYGCIGDGMVIALLDTGLLTSHEAFKDYGRIENPRLSEADVNAAGTSVRGKYLSAKIPFAYDYADKDDNVNPSKNTPSGDHGTHVAGIAAGYAEKGGVITFQGVSPNAQLLIMKVFSDSNSLTWASTYFYALEDAHRLGADVINLSLGTVGGFTYDAALETDLFGNIYKTLRDAGVIVSVAVGNASSMGVNAENSLSKDYGWEAVYADYVDYGTVGSPSTYTGNLAVSSVECTDYFAYTIEVNGISHQYTDAASDPAPQTPAEESLIFLKRFRGQTLEYVMVPGFGRVSDYVGLDVKGKVAVVDRGYDFGPPSLTFAGKMQNAKDAGAIAVIIYNDLDDGLWFMNIPTYTIPAIFVKKDAGAALQKLANETVSPALP
ncbi:MAG: S8 family serine peptidase, partial [Clostridiales bacterium]|nr:S8 family serine peptidase [Clostridiales bacterium]